MNMLLGMLNGNGTNDSIANAEGQVKDFFTSDVLPIVNIVIWILTAILAVVFIVKGVMTALAVMKAADEPQVRQEKIQGFKYLAIGLGIALVITLFSASILTWVVGEVE